MKLLITGGTGYIGENLIPELLKQGHSIRLLLRDREKGRSLFGDSCEYWLGDITVKSSLEGCCEGVDIIYHMAAKIGNDLPTEANLQEFRRVNVLGTKNMIEEAKRAGITRFIFISSAAAMGIVKQTPISENSLCEPFLPYQISKYEAEECVRAYIDKGFPAIIVRPSKICGIGEHEYTYLTYAKLCNRGVFLKVGKGNNYISNVYISDFINALILLLDHGLIGGTYLLSAPDSIPLEELALIIGKILHKRITFVYIPIRVMKFAAFIEENLFTFIGRKPIVTKRNIESITHDRIYNLSKAKKEIGFSPNVSMECGIIKTVQWYIQEGLLK
jgi:nucleoside-diphosphate-sugar epimerase